MLKKLGKDIFLVKGGAIAEVKPTELHNSPSLKTLTLSIADRLLPTHPFVASWPHYVVQVEAAQSF
jgi:hypothetical protein